MKVLKIRKLVIALMILIFIFSIGALGLSFIKKASATYWNGDGTKDNPYLITDAEDLENLLYYYDMPSRMEYIHFELTADIDMSDYDSWTPIGNSSGSIFYGVFDGKGHKIKNFSVTSIESYVGLFGEIAEQSVIKDLGIESGSLFGKYFVGAIAGLNNGTIINCFNNINISGTNAGGITGANYGTIINCFNTGAIDAPSAGGIAGTNSGTIEKCFNFAEINGGTVGGIAGINSGNESIIKNCYNVGSIFGTPYAAGIVGYNQGLVNFCYSAAELGGKGTLSGIVAFNEGTIENSFYNSDLFTKFGIGDSTDFGGCTTDEMTAYNTLDTGGAMELLQNKDSKGDDIWYKRPSDGQYGKGGYVYYPELNVFADSSNSEISLESVRIDDSGYLLFTKTGEYNYTFGDELNTKNDLLALEKARVAGADVVPGTFEFKFPNDKPLVSTTRVRIIFTPQALDNYRVKEFWLSITVAKAQITVPSGFTSSFTYDGAEKSLNIAENVNYTISGNKAINAGNYMVTFALKDSANYEWKDGSIDNKTAGWNIAKAVSSPTTINLSAKEGDVLSSITLPKGYSFKDAGTTSVGSAGNNIFKATYTTNSDTANYTTVEVDLTINVTAKDAQTNIEPPNDGLLIGMITGGIILACLGAVAMVIFISKRKQRLG